MAHEEWRDVVGYEGYYEVSDAGRIRSVEHTDKQGHVYKGRILQRKPDKRGYVRVHLSKDGIARWHSVHRLVATAFCDKLDGMDIVNHIDNNPSNNNAKNLEWTDYKGNMQHAARQGRMKGNPENLSKAVESRKIPVIAISKDGTRQLFESGAEASRALGVTRGHIAACCRQEYGYKSVGGYVFEYADVDLQAKQKPHVIAGTKEERIEELRQRMTGNKIMLGKTLSEETKRKISVSLGRPVAQMNRETGEVIATYDSSIAARKATGICHICDCANGKRKTAGGYKWMYLQKKSTGSS